VDAYLHLVLGFLTDLSGEGFFAAGEGLWETRVLKVLKLWFFCVCFFVRTEQIFFAFGRDFVGYHSFSFFLWILIQHYSPFV